jgi:deazaflavin-dependent oxidoreductase (nitroreductase family)
VADDDYLYLTTTGRRSGEPHRIEIWYADGGDDGTIYLLSGGGAGSDWVRNLQVEPRCEVSIGAPDARRRRAVATLLDDDPERSAVARQLVFAKYQPRFEGNLDDWRERSLAVAIDLEP